MRESVFRDILIIGGGPAGLSAALMLGRCLRRVTLFDHGQYRNESSRALHGFITHDGIRPQEFLERARKDLEPYDSIEMIREEVVQAEQAESGFLLQTNKGRKIWGRKLILATGVVDILPQIEGAQEFFGKGLYHCPYCDGWEYRGKALAVYGQVDKSGAEYALLLSHWASKVTLCTDGPARLGADAKERLRDRGIPICEEKVMALRGGAEGLRKLVFFDGFELCCDALFFNTSRKQSSDLALALGCKEYDVKGCEVGDQSGRTSV